MRETTRLLCAHVHIRPIAELIESYILPGDDVYGLKFVFETFKAGHWEECSQYFSEYWSSHLGLKGAIASNSVYLVRVMLDCNKEGLKRYIELAHESGCDRDIIGLLQSYDDRNKRG